MKKIAPTIYLQAPVKITDGIVGVMPRPCSEQQAHKNDPFTIRKSHYIGHDGFVVPKDFKEFYRRFPGYVGKWVSKHADRFATKQDLEDRTNDLLVHLMRLPENSKFRQIGKSDRVQTFDPVKQHGANAARFWNYINICLRNKHRTMRSERMKDALSRPGNLSLGVQAEQENFGSVGDEYCHSNSEFLQKTARFVEKQAHDQARIQEFENFVLREDPTVLRAIHAVLATGKLKDAADWLGITQREFGRMVTRLRKLRECFLSGEPVPKQRKPHKTRIAKAVRFSATRVAA
jgi:hypothetical protein